MADAHTAAKSLLLTATRHTTVAQAAGIAALEWVNRVHEGEHDGFIAGLHRGRLPAVELFQRSDTWNIVGGIGDGGQGTMSAVWVMRVHSGEWGQTEAEEQCRAIMYTALSRVRENQYFWVGDDIVSTFNESPLGYTLEVAIEVITAVGRDTYESSVSAADGDVPDGGTVGGISVDINYNDTSPKAILALPAGQAIDSVQVIVKVPFDGTGAGITIGIDGDQDRYMAFGDAEVDVADSEWEVSVNEVGPLTVKVWITPGTGASQGIVSVQITCTGA